MVSKNLLSVLIVTISWVPCSWREAWSQPSDWAKKVFELANEARINPQLFATRYRQELTSNHPSYLAELQKARPLPALLWDTGLESMARSQVEEKNLNPPYTGSTKMCGQSSGKGSGTRQLLEYISILGSNLHDTDYRWFGFYINSSKTAYAYYMGSTCERTKVSYRYPHAVDTSGVNYIALNTAASASYLTSIERQMVAEVNLVRAYPKVYAQLVKKYLSDQSAGIWGLNEDEYDAALELIAELEKSQPLRILEPRECLAKAASAHGLDCQKRGFFDHTGSDGSDPWTRIKRICPTLTGSENGAGDVSIHPRGPVMSLLIDSGIPGRGHRKNLLNPHWKYFGCFRYVAETNEHYTLYQWVQKFGLER
jgi:uncharacterized protein YkwD